MCMDVTCTCLMRPRADVTEAKDSMTACPCSLRCSDAAGFWTWLCTAGLKQGAIVWTDRFWKHVSSEPVCTLCQKCLGLSSQKCQGVSKQKCTDMDKQNQIWHLACRYSMQATAEAMRHGKKRTSHYHLTLVTTAVLWNTLKHPKVMLQCDDAFWSLPV